MKKHIKIIAMLSLVVLLMSTFNTLVFAASENDSFRFDYFLYCSSTSDPLKDTPDSGNKTMNSGRLYVRHYTTFVAGNFTNLFRGKDQYNKLHGSKWCTPGMNVPIQSNGIKKGNRYSLAGRGNTEYNSQMGQTQLWVNGDCFYNK